MSLSFRNYFPILLACIILSACKKRIVESNKNTNGTNTVVYIAGSNGINPVLWKNNVAQILSDSAGSANQVIVSGNDVYVAGQADVSGNDLPSGPFGLFVYWKNGVQNNIGNLGLLGPAGQGSVAVLGEDVYYANYEAWENGKQITLQEQGWAGRILSTFISNNDIYFAGTDSLSRVAYWKNGVLNAISQTSPGVFCIQVSGDDVYLGGDDGVAAAIYWKNGVGVYLKSSISGASVTSVHSLFVSGNDLYAVAYLIVPANGGSNAPAYWKNGEEIDLPLNGASYGNATSIFVSGSDVYVTGYTSAGAVYWKNGVETILSSNGSANSIYVQ